MNMNIFENLALINDEIEAKKKADFEARQKQLKDKMTSNITDFINKIGELIDKLSKDDLRILVKAGLSCYYNSKKISINVSVVNWYAYRNSIKINYSGLLGAINDAGMNVLDVINSNELDHDDFPKSLHSYGCKIFEAVENDVLYEYDSNNSIVTITKN